MKMPRDKRAHRTFGDIFGRISMADFLNFAAIRESSLVGWLGFILLCTVVTFLMTFSISDIPEEIAVDARARRDIRADKNYEIVNEEQTSKYRADALNNVLSVYDFDQDVSKTIAEKVGLVFSDLRSKVIDGDEPKNLKADFEKGMEISIPESIWAEISGQKFSRQYENAVISQVNSALARYVPENVEGLISERERGVAVLDAKGNERVLLPKDVLNILSLDEVKKKVREGRLAGKGKTAGSYLAAELIKPNFSLNMGETEHRRKTALDNAKAVFIRVDAGELIVRGGERYNEEDVIILSGIRKEREKEFSPFKVAGIFLLVALTILSSYYFAEKYIKKFAPQKVDLYLMGVALVFILLILRMSVALSRPVHDSIGLDIPLVAFYYAIPMGGAAMLIRFILNSETALVFSVIISIFAGVFVGSDLNYTGYCLISCIAASASIAYADKRSAIFKAGLYTAAVNVFAAISIQMINANDLAGSLTFPNLIWYILFAVFGGISCSVIVSLVTPLVEYIFGYTTDIKLLELANLNHPLLRELVIRAPGTYHHSHLVGILAEAAAEAIGANPLLSRVAAYYHDIGKIRKPLYFVENAPDADQRHEKLSPHMSALIVSSHVKDGIELATEYKIPKKIIDMIPQHHGTKMISFFYERAKKLNDPSLEKLDQKDFRYQGPKPQTREAGLLLLADAVEAAVRSLKEKSSTRIQQMVEEIMNESFTEAQFDECDLTLRNLHDIADAFTKILMGIYHQRIEYPKETLETPVT